MSGLTHIDAAGRARMVDVSDKPETAREAVAEGFVRLAPENPCISWVSSPLGEIDHVVGGFALA